MEIRQGYSYHIKDEFFCLVDDKYLMSNKEQGNYRPHYYAIQDKKNPKLYWMIPISSQAEKYKEIIEKKNGAVGIFDPAGSVFYLFFCFIFFGFHSFEDHFVAVVSVVKGTVYSADGCG